MLQHYYIDNLKLTLRGQSERLLAEMGLINMDEFEKYAAGKMPNRFAQILMGAGTVRKHKVAQPECRWIGRYRGAEGAEKEK